MFKVFVALSEVLDEVDVLRVLQLLMGVTLAALLVARLLSKWGCEVAVVNRCCAALTSANC